MMAQRHGGQKASSNGFTGDVWPELQGTEMKFVWRATAGKELAARDVDFLHHANETEHEDARNMLHTISVFLQTRTGRCTRTTVVQGHEDLQARCYDDTACRM